ncbi:MAG: AAA family ATPase, partial [Candidatus Bathyarchaeia archaeon]
MTPAKFIVVTGTPGTGKTAASRILSERLGCHHVELSRLSRNGGFTNRYDEERDTWIVDLKGLEGYLKNLSLRI